MKLVLDFYNGTYKLRINGTKLPSDPIVKELIPEEDNKQLMQLLADERSLIRTRQALLDSIRNRFNNNLSNNYTEESLKLFLESKYPEYFL